MTAASDDELLLDIVSELTGIKRDRLADDALLFHDLGIAGLDGAELLDRIGTDFSIDMSETDWVRYFGEEMPYNPFYHLWCLLRGRRLDDEIVRLRISDLKRTVAERKWQEPRDQTGS